MCTEFLSCLPKVFYKPIRKAVWRYLMSDEKHKGTESVLLNKTRVITSTEMIPVDL